MCCWYSSSSSREGGEGRKRSPAFLVSRRVTRHDSLGKRSKTVTRRKKRKRVREAKRECKASQDFFVQELMRTHARRGRSQSTRTVDHPLSRLSDSESRVKKRKRESDLLAKARTRVQEQERGSVGSHRHKYRHGSSSSRSIRSKIRESN